MWRICNDRKKAFCSSQVQITQIAILEENSKCSTGSQSMTALRMNLSFLFTHLHTPSTRLGWPQVPFFQVSTMTRAGIEPSPQALVARAQPTVPSVAKGLTTCGLL